MVTYNGDFFDCPFLETRAAKHGLDMPQELAFAMRVEGAGNQWRSRAAVHMDCMHWVNRDSYLPQGSRGLKVGALQLP
jgi:DNA polymerase epsilon subunit 1